MRAAGGLRAAFQVTPIQEAGPWQHLPLGADLSTSSTARAGDSRLQSRPDVAQGSGHGDVWQLRLVVVQEALALLRALLNHPSLGGWLAPLPLPSVLLASCR